MSRDRLELLWPGKYDGDGRRAPVPRAGAVLATDLVLPPGRLGPADAAADRLILADNLLALDALTRELAGQVDLVVLDPPFSTGNVFDVVARVGDRDPPLEVRTPAWGDRFEGGAAGLVAMLDPRLRLMHELLAPHGSLYLHVDPTVGHAVKLLLDDVFGAGCFQREIVWRIGWVSGFKTRANNWIRNHDVLLFYVKDPRRFTFNKPLVPYPAGYRRRDGALPRGEGMPIDDVWNASEVEHGLTGADSLDSIQIKSFSREKTGYATQKNESLLRRIVHASSRPGDLVLDPFCGSGTTLAVAADADRRFIGIDCTRAAVTIAARRLLDRTARPLALQHVVDEPGHTALDAAAIQAHVEAAAATFLPRADETLPSRARGRGRGRGRDREPPQAVAAWRWSLPATVLPVTATAVRIAPPAWPDPPPILLTRELLDPAVRRRPGAALASVACPTLELTAPSPRTVRVTLVDHADADPHRRPTSDLPARGIDLVDAWTIDWHAADPPHAAFACARTPRQRGLPTHAEHRYERTGAHRLAVDVIDVLHRRVRLVVELTLAARTMRVTRARLHA